MAEEQNPKKVPGGKQKNGSDKKAKTKIKPWSNKKKSVSIEATIKKLQSQYNRIEPKKIKRFTDFPLSNATLRGLKENGFTEPTEIQRDSIGLSLKGQDILGAAKTGSGKTLAFLIPVLEILYCKQWTNLDGLGALIITPTRELAYQIFETLRKVGAGHEFSAGLIIGGKDLKFERKRMDQVNIIVCTPGRLLQHMDENPLFNCDNLQVLVLDEADRILDLGFKQAMNGIIENLPAERQTLLFSATQTKSVQDLARLSLNDPVYISVHEHAAHSTPELLAQSYLVCELEDKISVLYSFIRNHLKHKVIVFMSSCKQVKYIYEIFHRLRPGVQLMALHGAMHQMRRMSIYNEFCRKAKVVMFATDVAARGLDFPAVNWVVQLDCPEDADTYIHRAGRTARIKNSGESLLILLPSEKEAMLKRLEDCKIPIKEIQVNPEKLQNPAHKIESFLAESSELKESAQRAFVAYAKSVFLMKDKEVFNIQALDTDAFARSLGLAIPPRIRFLERKNKREEKERNLKNEKISAKAQKEILAHSSKENINKSVSEDSGESGDSDQSGEESEDGSEESDESDQKTKTPSKQDHKIQKKASQGFDFGSDDSDDDVLQLKRRNHELTAEIAPLTEEELKKTESKKKNQPITKAAAAKKFLRKKIQLNSKVEFNEDGEAVLDSKRQKASVLAQEYDAEDVGGIDIEKAKAVMREEDLIDKQNFKEKIRAKHREEKRKAKLGKKDEEEEEVHDDFSSDESSGPDLSWLPDPDKVYGPKKSDDEDDDSGEFSFNQPSKKNMPDASESDLSGSEEESSPPPSRSKRKFKKQGGKKVKKVRQEKEDTYSTLDTGLSLQEDEELALKFLRASRS